MMRTQATVWRDQTSNHANISECKHMQGMKQVFGWDRPKKISAQQLLYQWTVELPLALKLPRCATCVQWIFLISGPDRVRVIIKLIYFQVICNGALWSCLSIISARAVTCTSSGTLRLYTTALCQSLRESGWARLTVNPSLPGGLLGRPVWL
jgi:hypothetical protein